MNPSKADRQLTCRCGNLHKTYGWRRSGFLLIIMFGVLCAAIILPYITVVARHILPAFLPFISQAGGAPPESGMLSISLIFMGLTGFITFICAFATINHRNISNSVWIRRLNHMSAFIALISCLGCIVTAAFPVCYTELPNQLDWVVTVLLEHSTGATMVLVGMVIFQFLLTAVWWMLPDVTKISKMIKLGFCLVYLVMFAIVVQPAIAFIYEELGQALSISDLRNVTTFSLPQVFSVNYKILAFFEWAVCFCSVINLLLTYKDFQRISLRVTLRHKSCLTDIPQPNPVILMKTLP